MNHDWRIVLEPHWEARADDYARRLCAEYESGRNDVSRAFTINGADQDIGLQSLSKRGEVALCIMLGGDPETDIEWRVSGQNCRKDYDVVDRESGLTIDVKTITPWMRRLIWPLPKNGIFDSKEFDVLALVMGSGNLFRFVGWVEKAHFRRHRKIAGPGVPLQPGTRYMDMVDLWTPQELRAHGCHRIVTSGGSMGAPVADGVGGRETVTTRASSPSGVSTCDTVSPIAWKAGGEQT